jgi:uncharacterized protein (DUF486 family)
MTFAWYAHLKQLNNKPWIVAALISWGIAFFEYLLQVPGDRIGYTVLSVGQLKMLQEVITFSVFVPFTLLYLKEPLKLDYFVDRFMRSRRRLFHISEKVGRCLNDRSIGRPHRRPNWLSRRVALRQQVVFW